MLYSPIHPRHQAFDTNIKDVPVDGKILIAEYYGVWTVENRRGNETVVSHPTGKRRTLLPNETVSVVG